ncbi:Protein of unknown function DUF3233 [Colwellia psychrerythraea]|uniref:Solitary outer membrane autotransporter-like beta-barrel domain-containing protein n=2 Tax=Colwellia psychrerythraea TaxID=28229 RepID=A0A099K889_COLPS|nr:Protein of unknown function DUF3233 [Colwellia psychrerythraea]
MVLSLLSHHALAKNKVYFEELFSTAVVLTDSETITLGVGNFDPDKLLKSHEQDFTESDSIKLRNELTAYSIPYTWVLSESKPKKKQSTFFYKDELTTSISYLKQKTKTDLLSQSSITDDNKDEIYSAYFAYSKHSQLNDNWDFRLRIGSYLMHHENSFNYNSEESQQYQDIFDGVFLNLSANAFIIEPNVKLTYSHPKDWGKWQYISDLNVFNGVTFNGVESSQDANPHGWRFNNALKLHYNLNQSKFHAESLYVKFQRSDIGGDMVNSLGTDHFYELGIGILLDTRKFTDLAENVGIGINIHHGSNLNGGSIVFYFNEL